MILIETMRMVLKHKSRGEKKIACEAWRKSGNFKNLQKLKNFGGNFKNFLINYETIAKTHIHPIVNENHYQ